MNVGLIRRWRPALCAFRKFVSITALGELVTAVGCVAINSCLRLLLAAKRRTSKLLSATSDRSLPMSLPLKDRVALLALAIVLTVGPRQIVSAQSRTASTKPNVVFILVDNVGWGDFSSYGGTIPTPRIDSIAADGLRFNNYTVEAQCTPSRSAILTGRLPVRSGTMRVPPPGQGDSGLAPWEYTLAELFSDAGDATGAFGTWRLA